MRPGVFDLEMCAREKGEILQYEGYRLAALRTAGRVDRDGLKMLATFELGLSIFGDARTREGADDGGITDGGGQAKFRSLVGGDR